MKSIFKIILLVLIFGVDAEAQQVTWQKIFGYTNVEDEGEDVIQTYDGGYVILSSYFISQNIKTAVIKTDQFGNLEWQTLYDMNNIGGNFIWCRSIAQSKDSSYIISGFNGDSALIFKVNKLGNILWKKRYSKLGRYGVFLDHKITHDGGIIACGYLYDPSIGYVVKTDSIGNLEWDSVYSSTTDVIKIIEGKDDSFYMLGLGTTLFKTNYIGKVIWKTNFFLPNRVDLVEHQSGNIFVCGGADSMYLYKIDTSGSTIFSKKYYSGIGFTGCLSMCLSGEGNLLLAGAQNTTMVVSKINPNGDLIFNKPIPTINSTAFAFLPSAVNSTNDYGFIFTGFTNYEPPSFHNSNIYATKTDSLCNAPLLVGILDNDVLIPESFDLYQNYPNPFNGSTTITYELESSGTTNLSIYDIAGKEIFLVRNEYHNSGTYKLNLNSDNLSLPSGIYFLKLNFNKEIDVKKIVLLK